MCRDKYKAKVVKNPQQFLVLIFQLFYKFGWIGSSYNYLR